MFGRKFARRKSKEIPKINVEPPTLPRLHMYESDEESIQASPILENRDTFGDFGNFIDTEVDGPVTGSAAPKLAAAAPKHTSTINFLERPAVVSEPDHGSGRRNSFDEEDDEALPFAATRQMATRGQTSSFLPEISTGPVMTKDHYETYRKSLNILSLGRQGSVISQRSNSEDEEGDIDTMQAERRRKKEIALARQQQEVHMSVHRQRVNKAAGGEFVQSTTFDRVDDEDDMLDDVPLSVLKAHNFPKTMKRESTSRASPGLEQEGANASSATVAAGNMRHSTHTIGAPGSPYGPPHPGHGGRGLIGEIMRQEELKQARLKNRYSGAVDPVMEQSQSMPSLQSMQTIPNPMLNEIRNQVQQMSELQAHLMQMAVGGGGAGGDHMSRMGYSRAASIRSFPQTPMQSQGQFQQFHPSPTMTMHSSPYGSHHPSTSRVRAVRTEEAEDEDDEEAWRKFAERRQSLRAEWMAA